MKPLQRRGEMTASQLVLLIILLVSTVVVILIFMRFKSNLDHTGELSCAGQVREANFRARTIAGIPLEIDRCEPRIVRFAREQYPPKWSFAQVDEAIKKELANEMLFCWQSWGEGELKLFPEEGGYCSPCATIRFDEALQQEYQANANGRLDLGAYLATNKTPKGTTYNEYFTKVSEEDLGSIAQTSQYRVDVTKPYIVLFAQEQNHANTNRLQDLIGGSSVTTSGVLGGFAGAGAGATGGLLITAVGASATGVGVMVAGAAGLGAISGYIYGLTTDDWYTQSAMYITVDDPKDPYVDFCNQLGATVVSP